MHTYVLLIENDRSIRRILRWGSLFGISREIAFAPLPHIARGGERGGACTRRRGGREWWRIYVMKRSPGWSRAWDARTHVPSPSRRETLAKVERTKRWERAGISLAPRERLVASSVLVGVAASRINGTGNMKQRARAWTHYTDGRETREYVLPPTIICQKMPLPWSLRVP